MLSILYFIPVAVWLFEWAVRIFCSFWKKLFSYCWGLRILCIFRYNSFVRCFAKTFLPMCVCSISYRAGVFNVSGCQLTHSFFHRSAGGGLSIFLNFMYVCMCMCTWVVKYMSQHPCRCQKTATWMKHRPSGSVSTFPCQATFLELYLKGSQCIQGYLDFPSTLPYRRCMPVCLLFRLLNLD